MRRIPVVIAVVLLLQAAVCPGAIYRDEAQFKAALGDFDCVDFNDALGTISGDRYVDSHGLLIEDLTGLGIYVRSSGMVGNDTGGGSSGEFKVRFQLDGQPVTVDGFGCIFGDVDTADRSGIFLYGSLGNLLDGGYVEAGGDGVQTYLGVTAVDAAWAHVIFEDAPGGVLMDDYCFTRIVPEPAILSLLSLAGPALVKHGSRKKLRLCK